MLRFTVIGTLLFPTLALAAPTIAVVGLHNEELDLEAQRAVSARVAAAIDATGNFEALSAEEVVAAMEGREELAMNDAFLAHGRKLLDDGRLQFQQAEPDFAIPVLESAVKELEAVMAFNPAQKELWEAYVFLGASQHGIGDQAGTMRAFSAAAGLNPERRPTTRQFPPNIVELYDGIASDLQGRVSALNVSVKARDATVWVDGIAQGAAPLTVEVLPGAHHVLVRTPDGTAGYAKIAIGPKSSKDVEVELQASRLGETSTSKFVRTRETSALYEALSDHVEADFWLVSGEYDEAIYAAFYSPAADSWSNYVRVPLMEQGDDETIEAVLELMAMVDNGGSLKRDAYAETAIPLDRSANELLADLLVTADPTIEEGPVIVEKKPFPWWVVAASAGAVAAGAGGYGIYRVATHDPNRGKIVVTLP
ncbi:MAG: hypothetical protein KC912_13030 [Proteobacteria bacterium]|nr:hypothetical protein [Pseudomonadota bacterium]